MVAGAAPPRVGLESRTGSMDLSALGLRMTGFMYVSPPLALFNATSSIRRCKV